MNYAKTAITSSKALKEAGMDMVLSRSVSGAYNPATGSVENTLMEYETFGVKLNYSQNMVDGSRILQSDQRVYLDPLIDTTPKAGDTLTIGDEVFNVVDSRPLAPGGICVLHDLQCRTS